MKNFLYGAGAAWSRLFYPGAEADPSRLEPESAPGPWPPGAGAAQKKWRLRNTDTYYSLFLYPVDCPYIFSKSFIQETRFQYQRKPYYTQVHSRISGFKGSRISSKISFWCIPIKKHSVLK